MLFGRGKKNPIKLADKGVEKWVYTTCGYCSTGCSIEVGVNGEGKPVSTRGVGSADVNRGKLCVKGIFEHEIFDAKGRGEQPLIRERISEDYREASWDAALDKAGAEIRRIQEQYGRDAFAIVSTGQLLTEEFYTLGKLSRGDRHQQLRRQHHPVHGLGGVRLQALLRLRRTARLLRGLREHRLSDRLRLQPARAASHHLLAYARGARAAQFPADRR